MFSQENKPFGHPLLCNKLSPNFAAEINRARSFLGQDVGRGARWPGRLCSRKPEPLQGAWKARGDSTAGGRILLEAPSLTCLEVVADGPRALSQETWPERWHLAPPCGSGFHRARWPQASCMPAQGCKAERVGEPGGGGCTAFDDPGREVHGIISVQPRVHPHAREEMQTPQLSIGRVSGRFFAAIF